MLELALEATALERSYWKLRILTSATIGIALLKKKCKSIDQRAGLSVYRFLQICNDAPKANISTEKSAAVFQCLYLLARKAIGLEN